MSVNGPAYFVIHVDTKVRLYGVGSYLKLKFYLLVVDVYK